METYETKTITTLVPIPTTDDVKMSDDVSPEGSSLSTPNNTNTTKESPKVTDSASTLQKQEPSSSSSAFVKKEVKGTTLKGYFVLFSC
jgi:hypothetical protein